eukprot:11319997-Prorocentrum_lima.AAC.1
MTSSLVGSEMCIRDRANTGGGGGGEATAGDGYPKGETTHQVERATLQSEEEIRLSLIHI